MVTKHRIGKAICDIHHVRINGESHFEVIDGRIVHATMLPCPETWHLPLESAGKFLIAQAMHGNLF